MSKHPGPWTIDADTLQLYDANDIVIAIDVTDDPETRAVLLHATEIWEEVKRASEGNGTYNVRWAKAVELRRKIESEIAAGRTT